MSAVRQFLFVNLMSFTKNLSIVSFKGWLVGYSTCAIFVRFFPCMVSLQVEENFNNGLILLFLWVNLLGSFVICYRALKGYKVFKIKTYDVLTTVSFRCSSLKLILKRLD